MSVSTTFPPSLREDRQPNVADAGALVLEVLGDEACRHILGETGAEPMTANELADICDLSVSTTYRKLSRLKESGLLEERLRMCRSGKHTREYVRRFDGVRVSVGVETGFTPSVMVAE